MKNEWFDIVSRLTPSLPIELDRPSSNAHNVSTQFLGSETVAIPMELFPVQDSSTVPIGIRVRNPSEVQPDHVARLAALACERGVYPVIFSYCDLSGFEPFGFRVERLLSGDTESELVQEDQLKSFWGISIVFDLSEVALLS